MEWIEVTGRTVDEAELEFELLDDARSGFLGRIGRSDARIRARIKPLSREKPADRRRRRKSEGRGDGDGSKGSSGNRGRRQPARARESKAPRDAAAGATTRKPKSEASKPNATAN